MIHDKCDSVFMLNLIFTRIALNNHKRMRGIGTRFFNEY